jgi:putative SOS response-associated peptidase YedK
MMGVMCGRFALTADALQLPEVLRERMSDVHLARYAPRQLIRPSEPVLGLRREECKTEAALMLWGLIPSWAKDPSTGPRPINARSETVADKTSFRAAWRHRRCLIPATGFFEKNYFVSRLDQRSFWIAGLWERWLGSDGSELDTCTILTTAPNALIQPLHDRMPVLIPDGLEEAWLAVADRHDLRALEPLLMGWDPQGWKVDPIQRRRNEPSPASIQGSLFEIN